jgi:ribulose-phosphate 3-epimerase
MQAMRVLPSILAADPLNLERDIAQCRSAGLDSVHIDVMDGLFVPPISYGEALVRAVREQLDMLPDVHLMTQEPERKIRAFAEAGAAAITFHLEACTHAHRLLSEIRGLGLAAGISIVPSTPAEALSELLAATDIVLVMTVNPGWGGQELIPACLEKVKRLRRLREQAGLGFRIYVDGGIDPGTARAARTAGADTLIAGSAVFGSADRAAAIKALE